ncbi:hypothetical protein ALC53_07813 [Atta colombica]|uniref:Uncharacterized protein n=1 Tax=Atta colombica TaxID=520822 RepID=A0A195BC91_9HYME|nr:hypothetical protein ALC53_07813 [Atta colombica]
MRKRADEEEGEEAVTASRVVKRQEKGSAGKGRPGQKEEEESATDNLPWCKYIVPRGTAHLGAVQLDPTGRAIYQVRQTSVNFFQIIPKTNIHTPFLF